ncbi:hypothetical protein, partial [Phenylobacterium hankyongense]|uniref:hypothetical protein n=1 Tax=Phenylobacterium hankyongense TaxID=1813876 RepID=UPI001A9E6D52
RLPSSALPLFLSLLVAMSSCGNCDCADKTQCVKKGNSYGMDIVEAGNSNGGDAWFAGAGVENDPKCNCGPNCSCTTCTCGH